ncbi:hypothetical protein NDU88_002175, partial [Pleurodeles waltl]
MSGSSYFSMEDMRRNDVILNKDDIRRSLGTTQCSSRSCRWSDRSHWSLYEAIRVRQQKTEEKSPDSAGSQPEGKDRHNSTAGCLADEKFWNSTGSWLQNEEHWNSTEGRLENTELDLRWNSIGSRLEDKELDLTGY